MIDPLISMAFMTGLLGSAHCLGMCGGLVAALVMAGNRLRAGFGFQLLYHAGRVCTYSLLGALAGWLGSAITLTDQLRDVTRLLLVFSDLFIILVGLGSAGVLPFFRLVDLENPIPFNVLQRSVQYCLRLPPALAALPLGLLLGLLPCGLVYTMIITAAQTLTVGQGALLMTSFGFGTVPALLLFGGATQWLTQTMRRWMLCGAGIMVVIIGLYQLYRHLKLMSVI